MYAIYVRQSLDKKDSISIEMQTELCSKIIPDEYNRVIFQDKGYTGTNTKRPAFQRMLKQIENGDIECIVVYKLDRISRSLIDFAKLSDLLELKNVKLISYSEQFDTRTPIGQMLVKLLIMFAEMEQKTIAARISDNYLARAEMRKPLGGVKPYGYTLQWEIKPDEALVVKQIYSSAVNGMSFDGTAVMLNESNISSPSGKKWTGTQISRILRNPVYAAGNWDVRSYLASKGTLLHRDEEYCKGNGSIAIERSDGFHIAAGEHEGIIPSDVWLAVQDIIFQRKPSSNSGSGGKSWLQGLVLCGKCGGSCYVRSSGKDERYIYFVCRGKRNGICQGLSAVRIKHAEEYAGQILEKEIQRLLKKTERRSEHDRELSALTGTPCTEKRIKGIRSFGKLYFEQKKAAAKLLIKNVILTENDITIILR